MVQQPVLTHCDIALKDCISFLKMSYPCHQDTCCSCTKSLESLVVAIKTSTSNLDRFLSALMPLGFYYLLTIDLNFRCFYRLDVGNCGLLVILFSTVFRYLFAPRLAHFHFCCYNCLGQTHGLSVYDVEYQSWKKVCQVDPVHHRCTTLILSLHHHHFCQLEATYIDYCC